MGFRMGFVQYSPARGRVEQNIARLQSLVKGLRADLLVLPELANSGYLHASSEALRPYSEPGNGSGPFLRAVRKLAAETGGLIVTGFAEQAEHGIYNSAAVVDSSGVLQVYRKAHLFLDEQDLFLPGDTAFQPLDYCGVRIGMLICFDWAFPEAARTLALRGAHILAHSSNLVLQYAQKAMITRSIENGVYSITTNRWGVETLGEKRLSFSGASQIIDPKGRVLADAPPEADSVRVCDIDPRQAEDKHITVRNHLFGDRRTDLYA